MAMKHLVFFHFLFFIILLSLSKDSFSQNVGIGITTPVTKLHVYEGSSGSNQYLSPVIIESNNIAYLQIINPSIYHSGIVFGTSGIDFSGMIYNYPTIKRGLVFFTFLMNSNCANFNASKYDFC